MVDYTSTQELNEFVHSQKLINRHSNIDFTALVTIRTEKDKVINQRMRVMVHLDGYDNLGTLTLLESNMDPYQYPTEFNAKWQTFKHIDNEYLLITGTHTTNPDIGEYNVKITPIEVV
jgi:hypothetical protein